MMNKPYSNLLHKSSTIQKNTMETRIIKTFSMKMQEDVGTSKPQKHLNKVGRLT